MHECKQIKQQWDLVFHQRLDRWKSTIIAKQTRRMSMRMWIQHWLHSSGEWAFGLSRSALLPYIVFDAHTISYAKADQEIFRISLPMVLTSK